MRMHLIIEMSAAGYKSPESWGKTMNFRHMIVGLGGIAVMALTNVTASAEDDIWHRDTLTGDWGGARTALKNRGIDISAIYIGEELGDVSGGMKRGFAYEGRAELTLKADLGKLMGWNGGLFHVTGYQLQRQHGGIGGGYTGSIGDPSNIEARPATRLFTLWLQQSLFDDKVSVRAGQLAADDEFLISPTAANLINGTFGWADFMAANLTNGGAAFPLATPGVRVKVSPTPAFSVLAAAFSGDPAGGGCTDDAQLCNRHGTTFSTSGGTFWIAEAQYAINQGEHAAGLPGVYKLGAWYQNAIFSDQRFGVDAAGGLVSLASSDSVDARNHKGDQGIYAVADQMLWRNADKSRSVSGFLRVGAAPDDRNVVSLYVDGGFGFAGLIPGRDMDTLTLGAAWARISDNARSLDRDTRLSGDPSQPVRDHETVIEVSYQAQVTPWFVVQPDIQYIVHPGGLVADPDDASSGTVDDALVVGTRASLTF